jgi:hypothetical protein
MHLSTAKAWHRDRAALLHQEFVRVAAAVELEGAQLVTSLQALAARLRGTVLAGGKPLACSWQNLRTFYYVWRKKGRKAAALLPDYKSPAHVERLPDALAAEIQRRATAATGGRDKNGKGIDATRIHAALEADWKAGAEIPGLGTWQEWWATARPALPLPHQPPAFPWSVKTVTRRIGPKALLKMGNIGHAAALKHLPHMRRDYSKLRKGELYTLDDVRLDVVAIDDLTGRVEWVKCYILQEIASRCIVAFILKPSDAIKAEDVDELLAWGLQAEGFGIGDGYTTHIWFERGTVACSEAAQRVLEAGSDGGIQIHRTSMDGGVRWIGAAADKASGHSAGKATIESFNRKLHVRLLHLPGQAGNRHDQMPANLGMGEGERKDPSKRRSEDTLKAEAERLAQFRVSALMRGDQVDLKLPMLLVSELQQEVASAIRDYNSERGHRMQGFHQVTEAEVVPGVWREVGTF